MATAADYARAYLAAKESGDEDTTALYEKAYRIALREEEVAVDEEPGMVSGVINALRKGAAQGAGTDVVRLAGRMSGTESPGNVATAIEGEGVVPEGFGYQVAQGVGQVGGLMGLSLATRGVGLIPRIGIPLVAAAGGGAERQLQDLDVADPKASMGQKIATGAGGALIGASELILPAAAGAYAKGSKIANVLEGGTRLRRAGTAAALEGAQEAAAEVAGNTLARGVYDPDRALLEGSGEAGLVGGAVGSLIGAALPGRGRVSTEKAPAKATREQIERAGALITQMDPETGEVITKDGTRFSDFDQMALRVSGLTDEQIEAVNNGKFSLGETTKSEVTPDNDPILSLLDDDYLRNEYLRDSRGLKTTELSSNIKKYDKLVKEGRKIDDFIAKYGEEFDPPRTARRAEIDVQLQDIKNNIRKTPAQVIEEEAQANTVEEPLNAAQSIIQQETEYEDLGDNYNADQDLTRLSGNEDGSFVDVSDLSRIEEDGEITPVPREGLKEVFAAGPEGEAAPRAGLQNKFARGPERIQGPSSRPGLRAIFAAGPEANVVNKKQDQNDSGSSPLSPAVMAASKKIESAIRGKSLTEVADYLASSSPRLADRPIATKIAAKLRSLEQAGVKFSFNLAKAGDMVPSSLIGAKGLASYTPSAKSVAIWINDSSLGDQSGSNYETLLHELTHAATMAAIKDGNLVKNENTEVGRAVKDLYDVSNFVIKHFNQRIKSGEQLTPIEQALYEGRWNTLRDPDEVVAWALSNRQAQDYFESIKYKDGQTAWTKFVDAVRRALGLSPKEGSALSEILRISDTLLTPQEQLDTVQAEGPISSPQVMKATFTPPVSPETKDSKVYSLYKGLFEGEADRYSRDPRTKELGSAIRNRYTQEDTNIGMFNHAFGRKLFSEYSNMSTKDKEALNKEVADTAKLYDRGSSGEFAKAYEAMSENGRKFFDASRRGFEVSGEKTDSLRVKTRDTLSGKYRDFKPIQNFWPRYLSIEVQQVLADPYVNPAAMSKILAAIRRDNPKFKNDEAANNYLRSYIAMLNQPEFFGSIEASRTMPLPVELYDYSLNTVMGYRNQWARRAAQIEFYGQGRGGSEDIFTKTASKVGMSRDEIDRIEKVRLHEYNLTKQGGFGKTLNLFNIAATGLQLGNSVTAMRNLLGGTALSVDVFGPRNYLKAVSSKNVETEKDFAVQIGILKDDLTNVQADAELQAMIGEKDAFLNATRKARNVTSALMTYDFLPKSLSGLKMASFQGTEQVNRLWASIAARMHLADVIQNNLLEANSTQGRKLRRILAKEGIDANKLTAEASLDVDLTDAGQIDPKKMPETVKYIQRMVGVAQGTYRLDNTPLWVNSVWGRSAFKYWKFSTQIMRNVDERIVDPMLTGWKEKDYEKMGDAMKEAMKYIVLFSLAGFADDEMRSAIAQYESNVPTMEEVVKKFENEGAVRGFLRVVDMAMASMLSIGAFGVFGNIYEAGSKAAKTDSAFGAAEQFANFPGLAPALSVFDLIRQLVLQEKLTLDDVNSFAEKNVSLYRTTVRAAKGVNAYMETPIEGADMKDSMYFQAADINFMSYVQRDEQKKREAQSLIRRYGKEVPEANVKPMNPSKNPDYTERTPYNKAIYRSVLIGDAQRARILFNQMIKEAKTTEEQKKLISSMQSSLKSRAPLAIPGNSSYQSTQDFLDWAKNNTSPEIYSEYANIDRQYFETAYKAGLMPRRNRAKERYDAIKKEMNNRSLSSGEGS